MLLYLVRHGQSEGNVIQYFHGQTDYPLTELGHQQAREVAEKLRDVSFTRCCASPLQRAWHTAQACLTYHPAITAEVCPDLKEHFVGDIENLPWDEVERRYPGLPDRFYKNWFHTVPPGGEDPQDMLKRVSRCLDEIIARGEDTLVVSHFGTMSLIAVYLGVMTEAEVIATGFSQGCYTAIEISGDGAKLLALNR